MTTVRVSARSLEILNELVASTNLSMQEILDNALEAYRRQLFLEWVNDAYARLRNDPVLWQEVERERGEWDATLADGLDDQ